jgi:hypothetical protein
MSLIDQELFTVKELAAKLKLHRTQVVRIFECEEGVLDLGSAPITTRWSRKRRDLRIPAHVLNRVLERRKIVPKPRLRRGAR